MRSIRKRINEWGERNPWALAVATGWGVFVAFVVVKVAASDQGVFDAIYESGTFAFVFATVNGFAFSWRFRERPSPRSD